MTSRWMNYENGYTRAEIDAMFRASNAPKIVAKMQYYKNYGSEVDGTHSGNGPVTLSGKHNISSVAQTYYAFQNSDYDSSQPVSTYRIDVSFTTNLPNAEYVVLTTESSTNGVIPAILNSGVALNSKSVSGFQFFMRIKESTNPSNWNLPFGLDLIVVT